MVEEIKIYFKVSSFWFRITYKELGNHHSVLTSSKKLKSKKSTCLDL